MGTGCRKTPFFSLGSLRACLPYLKWTQRIQKPAELLSVEETRAVATSSTVKKEKRTDQFLLFSVGAFFNQPWKAAMANKWSWELKNKS